MVSIKQRLRKQIINPKILAWSCCLLLLGGAALFFLGAAGDWTLFGLILICPIMHFLMMKDQKH
jgi:hypothetical protein